MAISVLHTPKAYNTLKHHKPFPLITDMFFAKVLSSTLIALCTGVATVAGTFTKGSVGTGTFGTPASCARSLLNKATSDSNAFNFKASASVSALTAGAEVEPSVAFFCKLGRINSQSLKIRIGQRGRVF